MKSAFDYVITVANNFVEKFTAALRNLYFCIRYNTCIWTL